MSKPNSPDTIAGRLAGLQNLQRLGRNINGYRGEWIDISTVLKDCVAAARKHGWLIEEVPAPGGLPLLALLRRAGKDEIQGVAPVRIYISTGIHGDEPAGPLAARQLLQEDRWPAGLELWLLPCLNPVGFALRRRENGEGLDLNRDYRDARAPGTIAHIAWLRRQPGFDLCLCLHEDWEAHGFYVYELNPDDRPSLAAAIVARVGEVCPVDHSELIEGRPALKGIIRPDWDPRSRPQWPEAFFLLSYKTRLSYTLEAPSDFPLPARVAALVTAVNTALELASRHDLDAPPGGK